MTGRQRKATDGTEEAAPTSAVQQAPRPSADELAALYAAREEAARARLAPGTRQFVVDKLEAHYAALAAQTESEE